MSQPSFIHLGELSKPAARFHEKQSLSRNYQAEKALRLLYSDILTFHAQRSTQAILARTAI